MILDQLVNLIDCCLTTKKIIFSYIISTFNKHFEIEI